jgi:hypothetical protein
MVISIVQDASCNLTAIRINRPLTSFVRPTQTNADNFSATLLKQAVQFSEEAFLERCREGGRRIFVRVCLRVSAVNILKYRREI